MISFNVTVISDKYGHPMLQKTRSKRTDLAWLFVVSVECSRQSQARRLNTPINNWERELVSNWFDHQSDQRAPALSLLLLKQA
jgi:hypothetical protein